MTAIEASCAGFKAMADDTVRFSFDVEPRYAGAALELFRTRGTAVAIAALQVGYAAAKEPAKPKAGPLCTLAARWCKELGFCKWLFLLDNPGDTGGLYTEDAAAAVVRGICRVESRTQIDDSPFAADAFDRIIRKPYMAYLKGAAA